MALGHNKVEYEVIEGWEHLPEGWSFVEVAGVATDSQDRVYAFNRGEHPMIVFDRDGRFLNAWGEDVFTNAHGIFIGPDDTIYCADNFDHTVRLFTPDGTPRQNAGRERQTCGDRLSGLDHAGPTIRRAVQYGHQCGPLTPGRYVYRRWLRQRAGA